MTAVPMVGMREKGGKRQSREDTIEESCLEPLEE